VQNRLVSEQASSGAVPERDDGPETRRPAGFCRGPGHLLVYGNPAFVAAFGRRAVGLPARETLVELPASAFELFDVVLETGRPLERWIRYAGEDWRLTAAPRVDPTGEVYGVAFHMRARSDVLVSAAEQR
jgi:hypothetical protein